MPSNQGGRPRVDLVGRRFGKLEVLAFLGGQGNGSTWRCRCDCGAEIEVFRYRITPTPNPSCDQCNYRHILPGKRYGTNTVVKRVSEKGLHSASYLVRCDCGAERKVTSSTLWARGRCPECSPKGAPRKYGGRVAGELKLYHRWVQMRQRCYTDSPANKHWFGRGITVCDEWRSDFIAFERWALANGYRKGLSIDRVDVNGNYEPSNCEWVTRAENSRRARAGYIMIRRPRAVSEFPVHTPIEMLWGSI